VKKLVFMLLLLHSFSLLAEVMLDLQFDETSVTQGRLISVRLRYDVSGSARLDLKELEGQTLKETLYFHEVSPVEQTAHVVFAKVPTEAILHVEVAGVPLRITWNEIEVVPTDARQGFLFGDFEIPPASRMLIWLSTGLLAILGAFAAVVFRKKWKHKQDEKKQQQSLRDEVLACQEYEEVVKMWGKKHAFVRVFPHLLEPFSRLELVLFRYQFKPEQTEVEKNIVMKAYQKFKSEVEGGFSGI
jgi:HJR/Mrr/RecB family endonuclease